MRTAIIFLIVVVLIVLVGSFVPQQDTSAQSKVDEFLSNNGTLNQIGGYVGLPLTQVFVSPLFFIVLGSLYVALGACVLRRGRALIMRTVRRYPKTPQYWGEWGSWLFHTSFLLLLIAVVWGKATGFQGIVTITEGERFTETRAGFDTLQEGLLFNGKHEGYQVQLDHFSATYADNGQAKDYVSSVTVFDGNSSVMTKDVRVNDYLGYRDVDFYQQDYGWAPRLVIKNPQGRTVFDGAVQFFGNDKSVQTGVMKVPDFGYTIPGAGQPVQLGARMAIFPDAKTTVPLAGSGALDPSQTTYTPGGVEARNPVIQFQLFVGDLGINSGRAQGVTQLDTTKMQPYFSDAHPVAIGLGQSMTFDLPGADGKAVQFTASFPELHQYSLFLVKKDNGVPLVYASFAFVMVGLMSKLYLKPFVEYRRKRRSGVRTTDEDAAWKEDISGEAPG